MEHLGYLFAAYSAIFIAIFLYVLFIGRRQTSLEEELAALKARLDTLKAPAPPSSSPPER